MRSDLERDGTLLCDKKAIVDGCIQRRASYQHAAQEESFVTPQIPIKGERPLQDVEVESKFIISLLLFDGSRCFKILNFFVLYVMGCVWNSGG
jgi:hypothetical protein